jgi:ankyrin repeat protein/SNF2 family DNA or RNA helicase
MNPINENTIANQQNIWVEIFNDQTLPLSLDDNTYSRLENPLTISQDPSPLLIDTDDRVIDLTQDETTTNSNLAYVDPLTKKVQEEQFKNLIEAVISNDIEKVKELLKNKHYPDKSIKTKQGNKTLLMEIAIMNGYTEIVKCLIESGAPINIKLKSGVAYYHNETKKFVNKDAIGSLLNLAVINRDYSTVKVLLESGANVDTPSFLHNRTPLHYAVLMCDLELVNLLLNYGAKTDIRNSGNNTASEIAENSEIALAIRSEEWKRDGFTESECIEKKTKLLKDFELRDAIEKEDLQLVKFLLEQKTSSDPILELHAALLIAAKYGKTDIVTILIAAGADPNIKNHDKKSPLFYAITRCNDKLLKVLLEAGATGINEYIDLPSKTTPLHFAAEKGNNKLVELLLSYGAKTNTLNISKLTPADVAKTPDIAEIIRPTGAHIVKTVAHTPFYNNMLEAILNNETEKVKTLLSSPPSDYCINHQWVIYNKIQYSLIEIAAIMGRTAIALIIYKTDVEANNFENTETLIKLLHRRSARYTTIKRFLENCVNITFPNGSYATLLHYLACHPQKRTFFKLLLNYPLRTDIKDRDGYTALEVASKYDTILAIKEIEWNYLQKNDPEQAKSTSFELIKKQTELSYKLHLLLSNLKKESAKVIQTIKELLNAGASANTCIGCNRILSMAAMHNFGEIAELLIKNGANIEATRSGRTPLQDAIHHKHNYMIRLLIKYGADVNTRNRDFNPLCLAICYGLNEAVETILNAGADVNQPDLDHENRPLHFAAINGDESLVCAILMFGPDTKVLNNQGKTAWDVTNSPTIRNLIEAYESGDKEWLKHATVPVSFLPTRQSAVSDTPSTLSNTQPITVSPPATTQTPTQTSAPKVPKTASEIIEEAINFGESPEGRPHIQKACKRLHQFIEENYQQMERKDLAEYLSINQGRWGIDFAKLSANNLPKETWLKPFNDFLSSAKTITEKKAAIYAIKQALKFFHFSDSSLVASSITSPNEILALCLAENSRIESIEHEPLSDFLTSQTIYTFLWLKMAELKLMVNHPERYPLSLEVPLKTRPCFMLAQDANTVRVFLMCAHHDSMGFLKCFGADTYDTAYRFLTENYISKEKCLKVSMEYVIVSFTDSEKINPNIEALVLKQRHQIDFIVGEVNDRTTRKRTERRNETEKTSKKRARKQQPSPVESPLLTFGDLDLSKNTPTRTKRGPQKDLGKPPKRGCQGYNELEFSNQWAPISLDEIELENISQSTRSAGNSTPPKLPAVSNAERATFDALSTKEITPDNFYSIIGQHSLHSVRADVAKEAEKEAVLLETISPLEYPIESKLEQLPPGERPFTWNRRLKDYQIDALSEILKARLAGLSKLLSLDMGMGKTITFAEYIIQLIAQSDTPKIHLVVAPASLIHQHCRDLPLHFLESVIVAWQLSGNRATPELYEQLYNDYFEDPNNSSTLIAFLRIFAYFNAKNELTLENSSKFLQQENLQSRVIEALENHFVEICTHIRETPELEEPFRESYRAVLYKFTFLRELPLRELLGKLRPPCQKERDLLNLCKFAGHLLNIHPGRVPLPNQLPEFEEVSLSALRELGFTMAKLSKVVFMDLEGAKDSLTTHRVIVTSFDKLFINLGIKGKKEQNNNSATNESTKLYNKPIGSLVVDEASLAHTVKSKTNKHLKEAIDLLGIRSDSTSCNNVLLVTGTPFENKLLELWTLLKTANGDENLPGYTYNTLMQLLNSTIKALVKLKIDKTSEDGESLQNLVLKSFAHFAKMRSLMKKLIYSKKKTDSDIIKQWNSRISKAIHHTINWMLEPELLKKLNDELLHESGVPVRSGGFIKKFRAKCKMLIHPDLQNHSLLPSEAKTQTFSVSDILGSTSTLTKEEKDDWIRRSPELQAILTNQIFVDAIANKKKIVIVTEYRVQSSIFKHAIEHLYTEEFPKLKVFEFGGMKTVDQRAETLTKFQKRKSGKPSILNLMLKSGGQGLNIPQADILFLLPTPWNPGQELQAINRIVRVNQTKEKDIVHLYFPNLRISQHPQLIQDKKRSWEAFLMNYASSNKELLKLWMEVLKTEILLEFFHFEDSDEEIFDEYNRVFEALSTILQTISEDRLNTMIESAGCKETTSAIESVRAPEIRDPVGFQNMSANCWCNALLQMITSNISLRTAYTTFAERYTIQTTSEALTSEISYRKDLLTALEEYDTAIVNRRPIAKEITQNVRNALAYFFFDRINSDASHQEDVYEAFSLITSASIFPDAPQDDLFSDVITSRTYTPFPERMRIDRTKLSRTLLNQEGPKYDFCPEGNTSASRSPASTIDIYLQGKEDQNFEQLFQNVFFDNTSNSETSTYLTREGPDYILRRYRVTQITKKYVRAPNELFLSMQLFAHREEALVKICRQLDVPLTLTLPAEALIENDEPVQYKLVSFIVHEGTSLNSGHYYTYKKENGQWWKCNDASVTAIREDEIKAVLEENSNARTTSYLHHYTRA